MGKAVYITYDRVCPFSPNATKEIKVFFTVHPVHKQELIGANSDKLQRFGKLEDAVLCAMKIASGKECRYNFVNLPEEMRGEAEETLGDPKKCSIRYV
jgi:hypothetical protein